MEDILNLLRNKPGIQINEDVEFNMERMDHRTNQKYLRFFSLSCNILLRHNLRYSSIHLMGRITQCVTLCERYHIRQEVIGATVSELVEEYDV